MDAMIAGQCSPPSSPPPPGASLALGPIQLSTTTANNTAGTPHPFWGGSGPLGASVGGEEAAVRHGLSTNAGSPSVSPELTEGDEAGRDDTAPAERGNDAGASGGGGGGKGGGDQRDRGGMKIALAIAKGNWISATCRHRRGHVPGGAVARGD